MRVDELVARRADSREDPEPAVGVLAHEGAQHVGPDRGPRDPVEPVAPGDDVADELMLRTVVAIRDTRPLGVEVVEPDRLGLEEQRCSALQPRLDQVLDDLRLAVDDDALPGQLVEGDSLSLTRGLELDARVDEPFASQPLPHAGVLEQLRDVVLEDARPDPGLDVLPAAVLEDHGLDPRAVQQPAEREPRRTGADDPDLGPRRRHAIRRSAWRARRRTGRSWRPRRRPRWPRRAAP